VPIQTGSGSPAPARRCRTGQKTVRPSSGTSSSFDLAGPVVIAYAAVWASELVEPPRNGLSSRCDTSGAGQDYLARHRISSGRSRDEAITSAPRYSARHRPTVSISKAPGAAPRPERLESRVHTPTIVVPSPLRSARSPPSTCVGGPCPPNESTRLRALRGCPTV